MKSYLAGLQASVQSSYANNGKTTTFGRAFQKTINSQSVIGPPLTQWVDVLQTYSLYPFDAYYNPNTGHLFFLAAPLTVPSASNLWVMLFNFSASTNWVPSYVGKVNINLGNAAVSAPTIKGFSVYESGSNITPIISTTGAVAIEGGTYICYNLTTASFTFGGSVSFPASGASQAGAMYFLQDPAALGQAHVATTAWGQALPQFSSNSSYNTKVWHANGAFALPQMYSWDLSVAPTVAGTVTNGVSAQTTAGASTSPNAYFSMAAQNGYNTTLGDQIVLMGTVPSNFTAWAANTLQTTSNVYFIRDLQLVGATWWFNLSATSGGAAIVPATTVSNFTMMRAFGISSSMFSLKTGVLTAITGGSLVANTMNYCKPVSSPANTTLQNQDCISFQSSSALYMFKISDLTSGATTWPSLNTAGIGNTGTGSDVTAITTVFGEYSNPGLPGGTDNFVYVTNVSTFIMKPYRVPGSALTAVFGGTTNTYYAGQNPVTIQIGLAAITQIHCSSGFLFVCGAATGGQYGVVIADMGSDANFGYSGVVSPVIAVPQGNTFKYIDTLEQLFNYTDALNFWVRSAATSGDSSFSSVVLPTGSPTSSGVTSNGWTSILTAQDLSSISIGPYVQFCATYDILTLAANTPAQLYDLIYTLINPGESVDDWLTYPDQITPGTNTPSYSAWECISVPSALPSALYIKMINPFTGATVFTDNTTATPGNWQVSTNGGTSWTAFSSISSAFVVGNLLRYNVVTPPGIAVATSLRYQA